MQGDGVVRQHDEKGIEGGQERSQCVCVCVCVVSCSGAKENRPQFRAVFGSCIFREGDFGTLPDRPPAPRPPGGRLRETGTRPVAVPGGTLRETALPQGSLSLSVDAPPRSGSRTLSLAPFFVFATFVELFGVGSVDDDAACRI